MRASKRQLVKIRQRTVPFLEHAKNPLFHELETILHGTCLRCTEHFVGLYDAKQLEDEFPRWRHVTRR